MVQHYEASVCHGRLEGTEVSTPIRFDDSLPAFAKLVESAWGTPALSKNLFLRDASGRLTLITLESDRSTEERAKLASLAASELGAYVDGDGFSVATPDELFDESLKNLNQGVTLSLDHKIFHGSVRLVDRRMVGADWLRMPEPTAPAPARFVFASLKGGVGRSTALCVLAAHLAVRGRRVLAIDMDLEAPGLGNLLLPDDILPEYGLLDYLVEAECGNPLDDEFFADLIGPSWLGGGRGRVDVIPAIGKRSLSNPANVLSKLARAYLASVASDGTTLSFSDHMRTLVDRFADPLHYDAILIDARAGLHETTAAAVIGLGAEVLFFGLDQPQTFTGYELLFAHLATLTPLPGDDWRSCLHVIQAKAPADQQMRAGFSERMNELLVKNLWPSPLQDSVSIAPADLKGTFEVEWTDENSTVVESLIDTEGPPPVVAILDDEQFRSFDPLANRDILAGQFYSVAFGSFLEMAEIVVASAAETGKTDSRK